MPDDSPQDLAALRDYIAAHDSRCPTCGYRLAGLPDPRCPECGAMPTLKKIPASRQGLVLPGDGFVIQYGAAAVALVAIAGLLTTPGGIILSVLLLLRAAQMADDWWVSLIGAVLIFILGMAPFLPLWLWCRWIDRRQQGLRAREAWEGSSSSDDP